MHLRLWSWREQCVREQPCTSVSLCFCLASLPGTTGLSNNYRLQSEAQQHLGCFPRRGETYGWSSLCGQDEAAGREPPWGRVGLLRKGGVCTDGGMGRLCPPAVWNWGEHRVSITITEQ